MKTMITFLITLLSLSLSAQTVTVSFQGAANRNKALQVVIDGTNYYSANSVSTNGRQVTTITNLGEGPHNLEVYALRGNSGYTDGSTNKPSTKPIYTKTFQLRQGYDMNIAVKANGQVSFTEKQSKTNLTTTQAGTPMSGTAFSQLVKKIQGKRYQSDKITEIKTALAASNNYFSTTQVRQLLTMITAESRRLELAKLSYSRVTDATNFSSLYDVLKSEANRDALDDYVVAQGVSVIDTDNNTAYGTAMTDEAFTQLVNTTRKYAYQADKITEIRNALNNSSNYFTTAQLRQLLPLVSSETERLTLVKLAYSRVVDRNNFNQLADLFYNQATRNDLNSFIVSNGGVANNSSFTPAMTDAAFTQVYNKARNHFFQKNTVTEVRTAFTTTTNYFNTTQIKTLLQLVISEPVKLELAKLAYDRAVDPLNYSSLLDLFTIESNRADLDTYIRSKQ